MAIGLSLELAGVSDRLTGPSSGRSACSMPSEFITTVGSQDSPQLPSRVRTVEKSTLDPRTYIGRHAEPVPIDRQTSRSSVTFLSPWLVLVGVSPDHGYRWHGMRSAGASAGMEIQDGAVSRRLLISF